MHRLDIAPLRSESPPQKRSGMARVLKGFHSFTCTPTPSSAIGMSHNSCLCLSQLWLVLVYRPRRDGRLSRPWCDVAPAEIRTCNLPLANPALYHTATSAPFSCAVEQEADILSRLTGVYIATGHPGCWQRVVAASATAALCGVVLYEARTSLGRRVVPSRGVPRHRQTRLCVGLRRR